GAEPAPRDAGPAPSDPSSSEDPSSCVEMSHPQGAGGGGVAKARTMNTLTIQQRNGVATITLARAEVHNAFNGEMIRELTEAFEKIGADPQVRAVILAAEGKTFCAGADL